MFNFKKFEDVDKSFSAKMTIRQKTAQLGFNNGAINLFQINEFEFAILYFDEEKRVIGVELANESQPGAIQIKKGVGNTYIRAKNFCDKYAIDYSNSFTNELNRDDDSGFLWMSLGKTDQSVIASDIESSADPVENVDVNNL